MAVTGVVSPSQMLTNTGARPGDALILTKPLGTGVLFNACRSGRLPRSELDSVLPKVAALNGQAVEIAARHGVHACTDITGFALAGHGLEMAKGSGLSMDIEYAALPVHPNVLEMYSKGETTGSNAANRKLVAGRLEMAVKLSAIQQELLYDPQTSGGLLLSVAADQADALLRSLHEAENLDAAIIGQAKGKGEGGIRIV